MIATVSGPGLRRVYRVHELTDAGTYGLHFTAGGSGLYDVEIQRTDGRRALTVAFRFGIGEKTLGLSEPGEMERRRRGRGNVVEGAEMVGVAGVDDSTAAGLMELLGRNWMALDRHAGGPGASKALEEVRALAQRLAGKAPEVQGGNAAEFDRLAGELVARVSALEAEAGDAGALRAAMLRVQDDVCMRCHALYRFQFAENVAAWPNFTPKTDLKPTQPVETSRGRTRTPFGGSR